MPAIIELFSFTRNMSNPIRNHRPSRPINIGVMISCCLLYTPALELAGIVAHVSRKCPKEDPHLHGGIITPPSCIGLFSGRLLLGLIKPGIDWSSDRNIHRLSIRMESVKKEDYKCPLRVERRPTHSRSRQRYKMFLSIFLERRRSVSIQTGVSVFPPGSKLLR